MMRTLWPVAAACALLFPGCVHRPDAASGKGESRSSGVNFGLYQSRHKDGAGTVRVIPVYSHKYNDNWGMHRTFVYPLLSGWGRRLERDGRHTNEVVVWPLLLAAHNGSNEDEHWSVFSSLPYTRVSADVADPTSLRPFYTLFAHPWLPMWKPVFVAGVQGRQQLSYHGIRLLFAAARQKGSNGGSSHLALFPLVSVSKAGVTAPDGKRRIRSRSVILPWMLARFGTYRDDDPAGNVASCDTDILWPLFRKSAYTERGPEREVDGESGRFLWPLFSARKYREARADGTATGRQTDVLWPLIRSKRAEFTPAQGGAPARAGRSSRVLPFFSRERGPDRSRFTFWPLLLRWERTPEGRFFRPLIFLKFRTGD